MTHSKSKAPLVVIPAMLWSMATLVAGCGGGSSGPSTSTKAAVSGAIDMHCVMNGVPVKQSIGMCMADKSGALAADDASADATDGPTSSEDGATSEVGDDGGDDGGGGGGGDYGPTLYNAEGDDDDCKYHVKWTSTDVTTGGNVTFEVNVMRRIDDKPATGADVAIEAFLNPTHPTPTNTIPNKESSGGNYQVGPLVFDASGKWTVRFHFYETCADAEDSPHGHAAFYVNVP